jgi:hypothetical protein
MSSQPVQYKTKGLRYKNRQIASDLRVHRPLFKVDTLVRFPTRASIVEGWILGVCNRIVRAQGSAIAFRRPTTAVLTRSIGTDMLLSSGIVVMPISACRLVLTPHHRILRALLLDSKRRNRRKLRCSRFAMGSSQAGRCRHLVAPRALRIAGLWL